MSRSHKSERNAPLPVVAACPRQDTPKRSHLWSHSCGELAGLRVRPGNYRAGTAGRDRQRTRGPRPRKGVPGHRGSESRRRGFVQHRLGKRVDSRSRTEAHTVVFTRHVRGLDHEILRFVRISGSSWVGCGLFEDLDGCLRRHSGEFAPRRRARPRHRPVTGRTGLTRRENLVPRHQTAMAQRTDLLIQPVSTVKNCFPRVSLLNDIRMTRMIATEPATRAIASP